jgi:hypothetical protein
MNQAFIDVSLIQSEQEAPLSVLPHLRGFCGFAQGRLQAALGGENLEKIYRQKRYGGGRFRPAPFIPTHFAGWREIRPSLACESKIPMLSPLYSSIPYACAQLYANLAKNRV